MNFQITNMIFAAEDIAKRFGSVSDASKDIDGGTGFFGVFRGLVEQGGTLVIVAVSAIAFMWIAYSSVLKFRECQAGRADWAELMVLGIAGGAVLVFVAILLSDASNLLELN